MDLMMKDWNEESISYEKASNVFAIFTDVKDMDICKQAKE